MQRLRGFTLIELMVVVAAIAILAAIALPAYSAYIFRAKVPAGLDALISYQARMEQTYQDTGAYYVSALNATTSATCASAIPGSAGSFTLSCTIGDAGQSFVATVAGFGPMAGVSYAVDSTGLHTTVTHPKGIPSPNTCWSIRGGTCDS